MTVTLTPYADPDDIKEQSTLVEAVNVLMPGETLNIYPGTWPGDVSFPSNSSIVGSGRDNTILPGTLVFPGGGTITGIDLPTSSTLIYLDGTGYFYDLYMDGNAEFRGGVLYGNEVWSRYETGSVTVTVGAGVSLKMSKVKLGPVAVAGTSFLLNSSVFLLAQGGGTAQITNVKVGSIVNITGGLMTMTNVSVRKSMTILPTGGAIILKNVVVTG